MNKTTGLILVLAVVAAALGAFVGTQFKPQQPNTEHNVNKAQAAAPALELPNLSGEPVALADYSGKLVLVNFWATWCPPCRKEIPMLAELQADYADAGFQILGPGLDDRELLAAMAPRLGINYPVLVADPAAGFELMDQFGAQIGGLPFNILVDQQGEIVFRLEGDLKRDEIEPLVRQHLGLEPA